MWISAVCVSYEELIGNKIYLLDNGTGFRELCVNVCVIYFWVSRYMSGYAENTRLTLNAINHIRSIWAFDKLYYCQPPSPLNPTLTHDMMVCDVRDNCITSCQSRPLARCCVLQHRCTRCLCVFMCVPIVQSITRMLYALCEGNGRIERNFGSFWPQHTTHTNCGNTKSNRRHTSNQQRRR